MKTKDHGWSEQELDFTNIERSVLAHLINLKHAKHPPLNRTNSSRNNLMKTKRYAIVLSDGKQVWFYTSNHSWSELDMALFHSLAHCKDFVDRCGLPPFNGIGNMTYKFKRIKSSIFNPFIDGEPLGNNRSS